jgi:hypothetical protein
MKEALPIFYWI